MTVFGALALALAPLVISAVVRGNVGVVVPAQLFFGPAAFVGYRMLLRTGTERSMRDWRAASAAEPPRRRRQALPLLDQSPARV